MTKLFIQSFSDYILDANYQNEIGIIGNIEQFTDLSDERIGKILNEHHTGMFCYLVFHPEINTLFSKFVSSGAISIYNNDDTLFLLNQHQEIVGIEECIFDTPIKVTKLEYQPFKEIESLFPNNNIKFPGFLFFRESVEETKSIFVPVPEETSNIEELSRFSQELSVMANNSLKNNNTQWADELCTKLAIKGIAYASNGETGTKENIARLLRRLWSIRGDIGVVVGAG